MPDRCQSVPVPLRFVQVAPLSCTDCSPIGDGYGTECTKIVTGEKMEELYNQLAALARPAFTAFWMMASKSGQLFFPMLTASFSYGVAPLKEAACCYSSSGKG